MKKELLEIRYDSSFRPISWEPKSGHFHGMKSSYDRFGHLKRWAWGDVGETYNYDAAGRLIEVLRGLPKDVNATVLKYSYKDSFSILPNSVTTAAGGRFVIEYDGAGGLSRIQTPRGHFHSFRIKPSVGVLRYQYQAPWISLKVSNKSETHLAPETNC